MKKLFIICLLMLSIPKLFAQTDTSKANKIRCIAVQFAQDMPMLDLAKRFGASNKGGVSFYKKNSKNIILGARFDFVFGKNVKESSLLANVKTSTGEIIALNGDLYGVGVFQRGYQVGVDMGKVFQVFVSNKNSGILALTSLGFSQYKIKIVDRTFDFPQLSGDYLKGYDRLTNGMYAEEMLGYMYFSKSKTVNFYAGFTLNWGFTQGRRTYLYDVMRSGLDKRNDVTTGFKIGWMIPMYKKQVEDTYY